MKINQNNNISITDNIYYICRTILIICLPLTIISALVLSLPHSFATISDSSSDSVTLSLSTSCTLSSSVEEVHHASLNGGQYESEIGSTKINTYCNDNNGYAIYAIGNSNNIDGNTDLINSTNEDYNIHTGTYDINNPSSLTSSSWSMKLIAGNGTGINPDTGESIPVTPPTIMNSYNNYNVIPNNYTLVAKRTSGTNMTTNTEASGSYFNTTYAIYASSVQPAGDYAGKVKYLMVHPGNNIPNVINDIDAAFAAAGKQKKYQDANGSYYAMQDMSTDICNLVLRTGESTSAQLVDIRDNKLYWVTKEKDKHCWMTQNLDLDINGVNTQPLNSNNTDISTDPAISGAGIYGSTGGYAESNGVYTWSPRADATTTNVTVDFDSKTATGFAGSNTTPASADGGDTYIYTSDTTNNDTVFASLEDCTDAGHTAADCRHYHVGNYYNYTAAVASNNTNVAAFNVQYNNAENSICPKNWRLPVGTNDGGSTMEFGQLLFDSGITQGVSSTSYVGNGFKNIRKAPLWFVRSGVLGNGTLRDPVSDGLYWSSTVYGGSNAYYLSFNSGNAYPANSYYYRYYGRSVRCLAR